MRQNGIIVAIDGPTASGKSTTAKLVAGKLGYLHINTGAMYRAFALYCRQWDVTNPDDDMVAGLAERVYIDFDEHGNILLEGKQVADEIQAPEIAVLASQFSTRAEVREKMVALQQEIGNDGGVVLDGRDIGTVVFPDAELKVFLVASAEARAQRRFNELTTKGMNVEIAALTKEIEDRDKRDSERKLSPLRKADDALELDTTSIGIEEQVAKVVVLAKERS